MIKTLHVLFVIYSAGYPLHPSALSIQTCYAIQDVSYFRHKILQIFYILKLYTNLLFGKRCIFLGTKFLNFPYSHGGLQTVFFIHFFLLFSVLNNYSSTLFSSSSIRPDIRCIPPAVSIQTFSWIQDVSFFRHKILQIFYI